MYSDDNEVLMIAKRITKMFKNKYKGGSPHNLDKQIKGKKFVPASAETRD